jgi:outer membrane lipoprotein-sorting protein
MKSITAITLIVFSFALPMRGADDNAASVLARADVFRNPIDSFSVDIELTSFAPGGRTDTSRFRVYGKGNDRSIVEFIFPQTEKGKYLLMLRDAMWIYIPTASRPIRISPLQRLMGQASNGDVARTNFSIDYDAKSVAEDGDTFVVDLLAKDPAVAYNRVRLWIDKQSYEPRRADFYVVSGKLIKRANYLQYGTMAGRRVVTEVEIDDLLRPGNRTVMRYANLTPKENAEKMFTKDALGKW